MKTIHDIDVKFLNTRKSKRILSLHTHRDHRVFEAHDVKESPNFDAYISVGELINALAKKKDIHEILKAVIEE